MDDSGYVQVTGFPTERQANAAAEQLVMRGIGATVASPDSPDGPAPDLSLVSGPVPPPESTDPEQRFRVLVVDTDRSRAAEILGVVTFVEDDHIDKVRAGVPPMRYLVVAALFAFICIPLIAGYVTFKLSGG